MTPRHFNVLFLCTGNSARSIMAEAIMNRTGFPNFTGHSAGSHPLGHVDPHALKQIVGAGMPVEGLRSKSWSEFDKPEAPEIHFVFNLCDSAVDEPCPVWPGQPLTARWSVRDPAAATGTDAQIQRAYFEAYRMLDRRILLFVSLPLAKLEREVVQREIDKIGQSQRFSRYLKSDASPIPSDLSIEEDAQCTGLGSDRPAIGGNAVGCAVGNKTAEGPFDLGGALGNSQDYRSAGFQGKQ